MNKSGYKRFPTINGVRVVFVSEDDLWEVPSSGGVARRLTSNAGEVTNPYFSPNGKHIAFSGKEEGEKDVYVIPSQGGGNRRITFIGKDTRVVGWTQDSKFIIFASDANQPFERRSELYKVAFQGGLPEKLQFGVANNIAFGPKGQVLLGRNTLDPARWKRYKGGRAGVFWIDLYGDGKFKRFLDNVNGNLASPMWIGDRIYFISDHEGIGRLYSCTPEGDNIKCHSQNKDYYIRNSSSDDKRIVYHAGAEIFVFDPTTNETRQVEIEYYSPHIQRQRKFVEAEKYLEEYNINPDGKSLTVTTRGKSYTFSNWEGPVLQIGKSNGVRYRLTQWLHDKENIITVSDDGGNESIEIHSVKNAQKTVRRFESLDVGIIASLKVSPKENKVVFSNNRHELFLLDLDKEILNKIARSKFERIEDFNFSSDGKWIVYSSSNEEFLASLYLYNLDTGINEQITSTGFRDYQPVFDPEGRFIYFLSARDYNPVYDTSYFQLGFSLGTKPYLISLRKNIPSPFTPEYERLFGEKKSKDEKKSEDIKTEVDFDGIQNRITAFPLKESHYLQLAGIKDGILISKRQLKGALDRSPWDEDSESVLERFDFYTQKSEEVADKIKNFKLSMKGKTLVYRSKEKLFLKSDLLEPAEDMSKEKDLHMHLKSKSDWIDLNRIKVNLDPMSEWKQMYRETWRLQKEHFWTPDMAGVDWNLVYERYLPLLDKVATRSEFSDLIWEMQGELGTSHAYEMGGDYKQPPNYKLGSLAADYEFDKKENAYKITHIVKGDSWKNDSPLLGLGVDVKENDYIIAINGDQVNAEVSPNTLLVNQANNVISITTKSGHSNDLKSFNIKTIPSDTPARYREWVEKNREYVHKKSEGKLGYLHIPDMMAPGSSEFHRYYIYEVSREGLIVDARYNRGGHVSQLLLEKLSRKRVGYDLSRYGATGTYPCHSVGGPIVAIANEHAGSDGDIFSHNFKQMNLGTLIGKRTWGGVIGINPHLSLTDGTVTTQPEYATYMKDVGWNVENYGTDPDIEIDIAPQDYTKGKDPQLDKAIEIALEQLQKNPVEIPKFDDKPMLPLPVFEIKENRMN